jgi:hypothetical protein
MFSVPAAEAPTHRLDLAAKPQELFAFVRSQHRPSRRVGHGRFELVIVTDRR